jgi:hypothetical protein
MGTRKGSSPKSPSGKAEAKRKALGRPSGKPPKIIDYKELETMAALGMTHKSMAVLLGIHDTSWTYWLEKDPKFAKAYKNGRGKGERKLLGSLMNLVQEKSLGAIIFSLKSIYGYRENVNLVHLGDPEKPVNFVHKHMTEAEINQRIEELLRNGENKKTISATIVRNKDEID